MSADSAVPPLLVPRDSDRDVLAHDAAPPTRTLRPCLVAQTRSRWYLVNLLSESVRSRAAASFGTIVPSTRAARRAAGPRLPASATQGSVVYLDAEVTLAVRKSGTVSQRDLPLVSLSTSRGLACRWSRQPA